VLLISKLIIVEQQNRQILDQYVHFVVVNQDPMVGSSSIVNKYGHFHFNKKKNKIGVL
jgi:hypothetical protein